MDRKIVGHTDRWTDIQTNRHTDRRQIVGQTLTSAILSQLNGFRGLLT